MYNYVDIALDIACQMPGWCLDALREQKLIEWTIYHMMQWE